jgi:hypothetical protein
VRAVFVLRSPRPIARGSRAQISQSRATPQIVGKASVQSWVIFPEHREVPQVCRRDIGFLPLPGQVDQVRSLRCRKSLACFIVRREKALDFSGCKSRPGTGSLHPVAIGAAVEVTKLLKPPV